MYKVEDLKPGYQLITAESTYVVYPIKELSHLGLIKDDGLVHYIPKSIPLDKLKVEDFYIQQVYGLESMSNNNNETLWERKVKLTREEIAAKFGISVDRLEIV